MVQIQIAALMLTCRPYRWPFVAEMLARQTFRPSVLVICPHKQTDAAGLVALEKLLKPAGIRVLVVPNQVTAIYGTAMHNVMNAAAGLLDIDGIICKIDDDDYYGPEYFSEVVKCYTEHPDALLIGKHGSWIMWMDAAKNPLFWQDATNKGCTRSLLGPTICTPIKSYRKYPQLRYKVGMTFGIDNEYVKCAREIVGGAWPPIYTTGTNNFILQRWVGSGHNHIWKAPMLY